MRFVVPPAGPSGGAAKTLAGVLNIFALRLVRKPVPTFRGSAEARPSLLSLALSLLGAPIGGGAGEANAVRDGGAKKN